MSGACVYGLLQWRATKLPAAEQKILREQVLVARGSAKEQNYNAEIDAATERILQGRLKNSPVDKVDVPEVRTQIREQVKADFQLVPPGYSRQWQIDLGFAKNFLRNKPLQLRVKFNSRAEKRVRHVLRAVAGGRSELCKFVAQRADEPRAGHVS